MAPRAALKSPFHADDVTGLPTVPPGIEADRQLYAALSNWEGEGLPPHPDFVRRKKPTQNAPSPTKAPPASST